MILFNEEQLRNNSLKSVTDDPLKFINSIDVILLQYLNIPFKFGIVFQINLNEKLSKLAFEYNIVLSLLKQSESLL